MYDEDMRKLGDLEAYLRRAQGVCNPLEFQRRQHELLMAIATHLVRPFWDELDRRFWDEADSGEEV